MSAKLHHYVPQFLLKRFSALPSAKNPPLWCLEKETGRAFHAGAKGLAAITHHNRLEGTGGLDPDAVERLLGRIEGAATPAIERLVAGDGITPSQRRALALFVWVQHQRTPDARAWHVYLLQESARLAALKTVLDDPGAVTRHFERRGAAKSSADIEAFRRRVIEQLDRGDLAVELSHDGGVATTFLLADRGIRIVSDMSWVGLRPAPGAEFILSDRPLAMYDPRAAPNEPVAWLSSATVEITLPLDPTLCLLLRPGAPGYQEVAIDAPTTENINLRTTAWAATHLYGRSKPAVLRAWQLARKKPSRVSLMAPRPPRLTILNRIEGQDHPFKVDVLQPPPRSR